MQTVKIRLQVNRLNNKNRKVKRFCIYYYRFTVRCASFNDKNDIFDISTKLICNYFDQFFSPCTVIYLQHSRYHNIKCVVCFIRNKVSLLYIYISLYYIIYKIFRYAVQDYIVNSLLMQIVFEFFCKNIQSVMNA